jgi:hypothetical protein
MTTKIDGTNGIVFPDGTTQSTAFIGLGLSQTWQNVTSSRAIGTTYTNTTAKPIQVNISIIGGAANSIATLTVNSLIVSQTQAYAFTAQSMLSAVIPPGNTYILGGTLSSINLWAELR